MLGDKLNLRISRSRPALTVATNDSSYSYPPFVSFAEVTPYFPTKPPPTRYDLHNVESLRC